MGAAEEAAKEAFRARGFGLRIGFGSRPAVVVIDLLNAFTDPTMPLGSNLDAEIAATTALLESARSAGIPIFYTTIGYEEEDMADAGVWLLKQRGLLSLRAGTNAVELDPRLNRRSDEPVVRKQYASAFFGTDFVSRLNARQIDTLLIAGCTTSGCVRATAVDAVQYGFRPMIVREAVGDRDEGAHGQALFDLGQKYADVIALDEALAYLRPAAPDG
jgi:maleamate amidohydrolase